MRLIYSSKAVMFQTLVILAPVFFRQRGHFGYLRQPLEHGILCQERHSLQYIHVFQYINDSFKKAITIIQLLLEIIMAISFFYQFLDGVY